jgi:hypothetical protein
MGIPIPIIILLALFWHHCHSERYQSSRVRMQAASLIKSKWSPAGIPAIQTGPPEVAEAFQKASAGATGAVSSVYSAATDGASRTAEAISDATKATAATMQDTGAKLGSTVQQNLSDLFERQPLLLGAVGLAIGAGIASSIPITEAEKTVMGQTSDLIRDTVSGESGAGQRFG